MTMSIDFENQSDTFTTNGTLTQIASFFSLGIYNTTDEGAAIRNRQNGCQIEAYGDGGWVLHIMNTSDTSQAADRYSITVGSSLGHLSGNLTYAYDGSTGTLNCTYIDNEGGNPVYTQLLGVQPTGDIAPGLATGVILNSGGVNVNLSASINLTVDDFKYYNISTANGGGGGGGDTFPTTEFPHPQNNSNWHDIVTLNISFENDAIVSNVTFRIQDGANGDNPHGFIFNFTVFNSSNTTNGDYHLRYNTRTYLIGGDSACGGGCNITVDVYNATYDGTNGVLRVELNGAAGAGNAGFFVNNDRPGALNLTINGSLVDNQNFSDESILEFTAVVNDSHSADDIGNGIQGVKFRVWNATYSVNVTGSTTYNEQSQGLWKNTSLWNASINLSAFGFANGTIYNVSVLVNDSITCKAEGGGNSCLPNLNETTYLQMGMNLGPAAAAPDTTNNMNIVVEDPSPVNSSYWHGTMIFNISTNGEGVRNVTFRVQNAQTDIFEANFTVFNSTNNTNRDWHVRFNMDSFLATSTLYNITVEMYNSSYDGTLGYSKAEIAAGDGAISAGFYSYLIPPYVFNLSIDNSLTDNQEFAVGSTIQVAAVVNDTFNQADSSNGLIGVSFRIWNSTFSFNTSATTNHTTGPGADAHKNQSYWVADVTLSNVNIGSNYNISVQANDSARCASVGGNNNCLPNLNDTTYLTIGIAAAAETTPPAVTLNNPLVDENNFSKTTGNVTFNVTVFEANPGSVLFSFDNKSGTAFNITATNQSGYWVASYNVSNLGEGDGLTVTVLANDSSGNLNWTQTFTLILDYTPPNISIITPLAERNFTLGDGGSVNSTLNMSIKNNADGSTLRTPVFIFDNSTGVDFNVTPTNGSGYWAASYNLTNLVEGSHTITFYARDFSNNVHNNLTRTFTVDTIAPVVTISAPSNNSILTGSGNSSFTATIKDLTIQSVIFSFDNATNSSFNATATNNSGTWTVSYSLAALQNGTHTMTVLANDTFGLTNWSQVVNFNVSSGAPVVSIVNAADRNYTSASGTQVFNASIFENNISVVTFSFDNSTGVDFNRTPTNGSGYWSTSLAIGFFTEGRHVMTVYSNDTDGNTENSKTLAFTLDNTAPNVSIEDEISTGLDKNYTIGSFNQSFNASIRDLLMNSMTNVKFSFDNASGTGFNATAVKEFATSNSTWVLKYNVSSLAEGRHTVRIFANDTVGNMNATQTIQFTTDNTAPNVTVHDELTTAQDKNFTLTSSNQTFNVSIRDLLMNSILGVRFSFDNATGKGFNVTPVEEFSSAPNSSWSASYNVSNLVEGRHTVTIFANDTLANINRTQTITYTLDNTAPNVTLLDELQTTQQKNFSSSNVIINASIKDLLMNSILGVKFSFDNASGTSFNVTPSEEFSSAPNSTWATSYAGSGLADGIHTVTIFANDTLGNQNATQTVQFTVDNTAPNVTILDELTTAQDKNFTVASSNQTFNVSIKDLLMNSVLGVFFSFDNASGTGFNVTASEEFATTNSTWSASYNVSNLADGSHTVTIFANDTLGNQNATQTIQFKVDNTAPITNWVNANNSNYTKTSYNTVFNVSIADLTAQSVFFSFDNGTGTSFNLTPTNGSGYWATTYNVSGLAEGNITVTVWANDTLGNLNSTAVITLTTDYTYFTVTNVTAGTPTASAVTITWNSSETANATVHYGTTTALGSATSSTTRSRQHSVDLSALSASTAYFYNVTSCDFAGNCNTTNSSGFTTTAAASTNTGSPGSGTSTTTSTPSATPSAGTATAGKITTSTPAAVPTKVAQVKQEFAQIAPAEIATVNVAAVSPSIGVTTVSFSVNSPVTDAFVQVAEVAQLPTEVVPFTGKAYKNLEITHSETITGDNLVAPKIEFKVSKSWLSENLLAADAVALHRHVDAQWAELPTLLTSSDDEFNYYSAETPGFSYFVIGEKTAVEEVAPIVQEVVSQEASLRDKILAKMSVRNVALVGSGLVALLAIILLVWLFVRKKK